MAEIATEMRSRMIDAMLGARWSYYTVNPIGRFAGAITTEANWGATIYRTSLNLMIATVQAVIFSAIVFVVDWKVAIIGLGHGDYRRPDDAFPNAPLAHVCPPDVDDRAGRL